MIKKGDCVINFSNSEGLIFVGRVSCEPNDTNEHDIEFFHGGSVSPVNTNESFVVPEDFAIWFDGFIEKHLSNED